MKINSAVSYLNFKRALSSNEQKKLKKAQEQAREELGVKETAAIIFDFNVPSQYGKNYAIGTMNSQSSTEFIKFLQDISSINKIQTSPQGDLQYSKQRGDLIYNLSPYSGTTFTLGLHTIALDKLCTEEYGNLLDENYIKSLDKNYPASKLDREYSTNYDYVLGKKQDGILFKALHKAFDNFKQLDNEALKEEFKIFRDKLSYYARKNIEFDSKELNESTEFLEFCQFLAFKQHMETKERLNNQGIKYFGDCLICFSTKEVKAHPECFKKDVFMGVEDPNCPETNNIQGWWAPSLNFDRLGEFDENGEIVSLDVVGELLYEKFKNFLTLYDGIRLDAFWQYVTPFEYNSDLKGGYTYNLRDKILKIIEKASIDAKGYFNPDDFVLELVGYGVQESKNMTRNIYPHVFSTAYSQYGENPKDLKEQQGYVDGKFLIGMANHDNDTIVNMSREAERRKIQIPQLKKTLGAGYRYLGYEDKNYQEKPYKERLEQDFRTAKAAEIFTTSNQYYTLTDLFGMSEKINNTGKVDAANWKVRIPSDYERFYYSQLSKGYGINFPKAYEVALRAKNSSNNELIEQLEKASEILAQDGPMTKQEADRAEKLGRLDVVF